MKKVGNCSKYINAEITTLVDKLFENDCSTKEDDANWFSYAKKIVFVGKTHLKV